jgi:5-methylcytosine-specific restriction endonuclease McrA
VSGIYLGSEPMSTYFHHIMPKEKYPELAYEESNIILLTFPEHSNVENDMYKYDIINEKRKELMKKYDLC